MWCHARTFGPGLTALALAGACLFACHFDPSAAGDGDEGDEGATDDGPSSDGLPPGSDGGADAGPVSCTPNERSCNGRLLRTCNSTGDGFSSQTTCPFTCEDGDHCTVASNVDQTAQENCGVNAPTARLVPPSGATVNLSSEGNGRITCDPNCGEATVTSIDAVGVTNQAETDVDVAHFCLSEMNIGSDVTFTVQAGVPRSFAFLVTGNAVIAGTIPFDGRDAPENTAGTAGPGGGAGGSLSGSVGQPGDGACPGRGGARLGQSMTEIVGGGGGGAGHGSAGGQGGNGRLSSGQFAVGGDPGGVCLAPTVSPLVGGSGGGGGGDGACGGNCGWPGGGGGGGIQISAAGGIDVSGTIRANGGAGFGTTGAPAAGGGGGGAGGAILLEGPSVTVRAGALLVEGGRGGDSGGGNGGNGAAGELDTGGNGQTGNQDLEGGAGGGGGGGRVRINARTQPSCTGLTSPANVCSTGPLEQDGSIGSGT
jgi:hypothetical protein